MAVCRFMYRLDTVLLTYLLTYNIVKIIAVYRRSSQQVYNVTIFFLFFMSLYGILGVQFFGEMNYHCVRNDANES